MKKLLLVPLVLFAVYGIAQIKPKKKESKVKELPDSTVVLQVRHPKDSVDSRLKGPNGETVYTSPKGGRYYMMGAQKVYLPGRADKSKQQ